MKYFEDCQTLDAAKTAFKKLCFKLHPDTSGFDSQQLFIDMQREFKTVSNTLKFKTGFDTDKNFNADKFYNIVRKFDGLIDINIMFIGDFIWLNDIVEGATKSQKETIKSILIEGYKDVFWHRTQKCWVFSPLSYKAKYSKKGQSLNDIKQKYGSTEFKSKSVTRLN